MKHNFKIVLALALAVMMIVGSFAAIADADLIKPQGTTADTTISITGLNDLDEVTLYQVIKYENNADDTSAGWVLCDPFASDNACEAVLDKINTSVNGPYALTQADVAAFTTVINAGNATAVNLADNHPSSGTFSYAITESTSATTAGMYIALIKPGVAGTLYNPIVVSSDFEGTNTTNSIASSEQLGSDGTPSVVKKETVTLNKEQNDYQDDANNATAADNDYGYNVGDTVNFTVTTTIPTYASVYTNPTFTVTDTMSAGLTYTANSLKVYDDQGNEIAALNTSEVITVSGQTLTVAVPPAYITALEAPQNIVIKYNAIITSAAASQVNQEKNTVELQFSNNPSSSTDKGKIKDETRQYTFTIDGKILGQNEVSTSELIKVGVDGQGNPIMQSSFENETYHQALAGATFALYKDQGCTTLYDNDVANIDFGAIVSAADGSLYIPGLEDGEYWLKELTAPNGYIKDSTVHHIVISATYENVTKSEAGYPDWVVRELKSYTITIDNTATSTYNMTLDGSEILVSSAQTSDTLLNNTKGIELPSTGGIGTTIFYVGGSLMVLAAAILLITKRRMGVED